MKSRNFLFLKGIFALVFLFFVSSIQVLAQDEPRDPVVKMSQAFVMPGYFGGSFPLLSLDQFRQLVPESQLLQDDFTDFNSSTPSFDVRGGGFFNAAIGLQFRSGKTGKTRPNPLLRIGVTSSSGTYFSQDFYSFQSFRVDTLVSNQTGEITYVDSSSSQYVSMRYESRQVALDAALIFRSSPEARWSVYGGLGISIGYSYRNTTEVNSSSRESHNSPGNYFYDGLGRSEIFTNENAIRTSAYLPIGVDFRLGNKREFWKRLHLFTEIRPGLLYFDVPELTSYFQTYFTQGFGVRVVW